MVRLEDAYITCDYVTGIELFSSIFEAQEYSSVADAYKKCVSHEIECLKAGDYTIVDVNENEIVFSDRDGNLTKSEVRLYDEDGNRVMYEA